MIKAWSSILFGMCLAASAQAQISIYQNPVNLQVLPSDTPATGLLETMKGFAIGTGFRCSSCHVGEEGTPLTEYDFASDEKPLKRSARSMMRMVNDINRTIASGLGEGRTAVRCITCHRGVNQPRMIGEVLTGAAESGGSVGMKAAYSNLREQYYGTHSYDFSDLTLTEFAMSRAAAGQPDQAEAMFGLLLEEYPESFMVHWRYGEMLHRGGKNGEAIHHYRKAIEVNPEAAGILEARIEQLMQTPPPD